jgi:hypothetical protein
MKREKKLTMAQEIDLVLEYLYPVGYEPFPEEVILELKKIREGKK